MQPPWELNSGLCQLACDKAGFIYIISLQFQQPIDDIEDLLYLDFINIYNLWAAHPVTVKLNKI